MDSAKTAAIRFQSTPPARGATAGIRAEQERQKFQSTPPARGATTHQVENAAIVGLFQSTPPARGATTAPHISCMQQSRFQSTPPARGATSVKLACNITWNDISIHAPREGGDSSFGAS